MHEEVRPTILKAIEESEIIGLLHCYVEQFNAFFTTLQPLPSTFSEINEANPASWDGFKQNSPNEEYKQPHSWTNEVPEMSKKLIFLTKLKICKYPIEFSNHGLLS